MKLFKKKNTIPVTYANIPDPKIFYKEVKSIIVQPDVVVINCSDGRITIPRKHEDVIDWNVIMENLTKYSPEELDKFISCLNKN